MVIDLRPSRRGLARNPASPSNHCARLIIAAAVSSLPATAFAQAVNGSTANGGAPRDPYRFSSSIGVDETWSDNINLGAPGTERSDFVTSISPSLSLSRYSRNLNLAVDYTPQLLLYARGSNGTQVRNYFDGRMNATIVDNLLYFDALGTIGQTNISPFGTLAANSVNGSSNRAETRTISLGPTLRGRYGQDLNYSAGYHYATSNSNSSAYDTNHTTQAFAQFENGTSFRNFGYGADISRNEQTYGGLNDIVTETAGATLTYVLTPTFHLRGRAGYDRNSYPTSGQPDLKGPSYSGGFDWQPSQHTQLNAQVGHRYFGPSANVSFRETTSHVVVSALYSRDQTTSSSSGLFLVADPNYALLDQFFRTTITDPAQRALAVTTALSQAGLPTAQYGAGSFLSNQLYLQKVAQVSVGLIGRLNTVTFDVSHTDSRGLSALDTGFDVFDQTSRFRSTSLSANWSHKLGPRTSLNATVSKVHNQAVDGFGDTRLRTFTASLSRQIGPRLNGTVLYRNSRQDGNGSGFGGGLNSNFYSGVYRENAVLGSLRYSFQ